MLRPDHAKSFLLKQNMSRRNIVLIQYFRSEYIYILHNLALHLEELVLLGYSDYSTTYPGAVSLGSLYMQALIFVGHILKLCKLWASGIGH